MSALFILSRPMLRWGAIVFIGLFAAAGSAQESADDRRSLSRLFGESIAPEALEVHRISRQLSVDERYEYLLQQVLPAHSDRIRMIVDYLPTNPSPPVVEKYGTVESSQSFFASPETRRPSGGVLISAVNELVHCAKQIGKLDDLQTRVQPRSQTDDEQMKCRLALEILIAWANEDLERAGQLLGQLDTVVRNSPLRDPDRSPESIVVWAGLTLPETQLQVVDLLYLLYEQVNNLEIPHRQRFKQHLSSLKFQIDQILDRQTPSGSHLPNVYSLKNWSLVSRRTAESRGEGFPNANWVSGSASARKIASHGNDYLYFRSPLRGNFEIEGDLTTYDLREIRLAIGGYWAGSCYLLDQCEHGSFRDWFAYLPLDEPLTNIGALLRVRIVVRDGIRTTYINGRKIYERSHRPDADPWIAIYCPWNTSGTAQNLRITGNPKIPSEIDLISGRDLPGWLPYYNESVGDRETDWRLTSSEAKDIRELIGRSYSELRGSNQESLLRYHRPMLEDGTIEYEFFYKSGESAVYPALDRCGFLFDREQAGIHWLTDGNFDRTGIDPANFSRRETADTIPLMQDAWNRVQLTLRGNVVDVVLNGKTILSRELEPENQRTFGLFHYADQSVARVRNLRWRGEWPKELPEPREQELADYSVEDEIADGPDLPVVFEHDFSEGMPADKIWGGGSEGWHFHKEELPTGVRISRGSGWYTQHTLSFPVRLEGDFDVTLAYEDFRSEVSAEGEGDIQMGIIFDDETATDFRVYRKHHHRKSGKHEHIIEVARFEQRENNTERNWYGQTAEEGAAGRIRVVRRKNRLFLLHASGDSPHERLIYEQPVTTEPVRFGGLKAIVETHRDGETSVIWKRITVRSEKPERIADYSGMTIENLDRQRAKMPDVERIKFNQETPADLIQTWGTIDELQKQEDGWRVTKLGTDRWTAGAFIPMLGMSGDYDVTLDLEILQLEDAARDQDTYLLLQNRVNSRFSRNVEIKLVSTERGKRELGLQQNTTHRNGSTRFEKLKIVPMSKVSRFRLARRGEVLYFVYQPDADSLEQIFGYLIVGTDDIPPGFLRTMFRTGGAGKETLFELRSMSLHAERLIKPDPS